MALFFYDGGGTRLHVPVHRSINPVECMMFKVRLFVMHKLLTPLVDNLNFAVLTGSIMSGKVLW